jgi:hypothetical protein
MLKNTYYKHNSKSIKNDYKICQNLNKEQCVIWSGCDGCYYFESQIVCTYCDRILPNLQFKRKDGCQWCIPKKP